MLPSIPDETDYCRGHSAVGHPGEGNGYLHVWDRRAGSGPPRRGASPVEALVDMAEQQRQFAAQIDVGRVCRHAGLDDRGRWS